MSGSFVVICTSSQQFYVIASLWEILEHWEKEGKLDPPLATLTNDVPACIYLRKEIAREDSLRKTSLADLGLMNGKAAIRFVVLSYVIR